MHAFTCLPPNKLSLHAPVDMSVHAYVFVFMNANLRGHGVYVLCLCIHKFAGRQGDVV
jgi:hypothetical protein